MNEWLNPSVWIITCLFAVLWLFLLALRPPRDYYILQRTYYGRLYGEPWRGEVLSRHYHVFGEYLPAKTLFDRYEQFLLSGYVDIGTSEADHTLLATLDNGIQEAEHVLFMVPARSKGAALARLRARGAYGVEMLHQTRFEDILKRRTYWQKHWKQKAETN